MPLKKIAPAPGLVIALTISVLSSGWRARADSASRPPCESPEHRQFDFWLGDWKVSNADGTPAGSSSVTRELGGCVIHENYHGLGESAGFDGQSLSVFEENSRHWKQSWVDNGGQRMAVIEGSFGEGKMVLQGEGDSPKGHHKTRVSWSEIGGGGVRQLVEFSFDAGKSWKTIFDGRYSRTGK